MAYEIFGSDITELKAEPAKKHTVMESNDNKPSSDRLEGRNSVMEAIKAGRTIDKVYIQDGIRDGAISSILSKLKGTGTSVSFVKKQRLDMMSETGHHQGIIAQTTAYEYAEIDDIFELAKKKGEPPFINILDSLFISNIIYNYGTICIFNILVTNIKTAWSIPYKYSKSFIFSFNNQLFIRFNC